MKRLLLSLIAIVFTGTLAAQTNPAATSDRFTRGNGIDPNAQSFVIPLNQQEGVRLPDTGTTGFSSPLPWMLRIQTASRWHLDTSFGFPVWWLEFTNPIAAFGSQTGGTPLYTNQNYRFGIYAGVPLIVGGSYSPVTVTIKEYTKSSLSAGQTNVAPSSTSTFILPSKLDLTTWQSFINGGYSSTRTDFSGRLSTTIEIVDNADPVGRWGTNAMNCYVLTQKATSSSYYYVVEAQAVSYYDTINHFADPMVFDNGSPSVAAPSTLYSLDFEDRPAWRSVFIDQPHFDGQPLPSAYQGKSLDELLQVATPVTKQFGKPISQYLTLDGSPELRRHPVLDKFVEKMGRNPIALANYVLNEIELTDAVSFNEDGSNVSIQAGGVNRGALATFLEGQGSPDEQCALLIYLLRQAKIPAAYVEAPRDKLLMLESRMSKLLRMQLHGAINDSGQASASGQQLIPVNYRWVAAYIDGKWVHIFPWLKDTEVVEGKNLYDYMPANYNNPYKWVQAYLKKDPVIVPNQVVAFQQQSSSDRVVMEAENYTDKDRPVLDWASISGETGTTGAGCIQAVPDKGFSYTSATQDEFDVMGAQSPQVEFKINFSAAGTYPKTYYVWLRGKGASTSSDAVHIGLNSGGSVTSTFTSIIDGFGTSWSWRNKEGSSGTAVTVSIPAAGVYGIRVYMRKDGVILDRVIVSTSSSTPSGSGPSETSKGLTGGEMVFQQSGANTGITMEAENFTGKYVPPIKDWYSPSGDSGFSGSGFMQTLEDEGDTYTSASTIQNKSPRLDYKVNFASSGTYYVWVRGKGPTTGSDSVHLGLDGSALTTSDNIDGFGTAWAWKNVTLDGSARATISVPSTGYHTVNLWMREDGAKVDRILITKDAAYTPTGDGPAQTPKNFKEDDTPATLFTKQVRQELQTAGLALDEVGTRVFDRKNNLTRWQDFPQPWQVTETGGSIALRSDLSSVTNIFDTYNIVVWSDKNNNDVLDGGESSISTGDLRALDLHNRRFLLQFKKTAADVHDMTLSLEAFRPDLETQTAAFTNDASLLKVQSLTVSLGAADDTIKFQTIYSRHRAATGTADAFNRIFVHGTSDIDTRPLRKGDIAALCLNFGRVTMAMLNVHAEKVWKKEHALKLNPGAAGDPDVFQGSNLYIMGMSYYQKVADFQKFASDLHKVSLVSFYAHGFAKVSPRRDAGGKLPNSGDIDPVLPNVDMSFSVGAWANNGTLHPDSEDTYNHGTVGYSNLFMVNGSAQEHATVNSFFRQDDAISTVKLLHQTVDKGKTIIELNKQNFATVGAQTYTSRSTTKTLQQWADDCGLSWSKITAGFGGVMGDYQKVYVTPGPIEGASGTYYGMGAFVSSYDSVGALISNSMNGAFGMNFAATTYTSPNFFKFELSIQNNNYSLNTNQIGFTMPSAVSSQVSWTSTSSVISNISSGYSKFNDQTQALLNDFNTSFYFTQGSGSAGLATNYGLFGSTGYTGKSSYNGNSGSSISNFIGDPVNSITGEFYIDTTDLTLPGPMPLEIRRNYGSQNSSNNEFGFGWKMAYFPYLAVSPPDATDPNNLDKQLIYAAEMDGSVIAYRRTSTSSSTWKPVPGDNPTLNTMIGDKIGSTANLFNAQIVRSGTDGAYIYTLTGADRSIRTFNQRSYPTGGANGVSRDRPYLDKWQDARGNFYTFFFEEDSSKPAYGELVCIKSSNGNFLGFDYDVYGHIIEAWTGDGRRLTYTYDELGDLRQVELPDASVIKYDYEQGTQTEDGIQCTYSKHLLVRETKPEGRILENTYDSSRRVTIQRATVNPASKSPVQNATFAYTVTATNADKTKNGYTLITDVYSRTTRHDFTNSQLTKITDPSPLNYTVEQAWYTQTETTAPAYPCALKYRIDKRGLRTDYAYDSRGNIDKVTVTGDITGDGTSDTAITDATFDSSDRLTSLKGPYDASMTLDPAVGMQTSYTYADTAYPRLPTRVQKKNAAGSTITMTDNVYYELTSSSGPMAKGLLKTSTKDVSTSDEAKVEYTHNANGFITSVTAYTNTTDPAVKTFYRYNLRGEVEEARDSLGRKTIYAYDGRGNQTWQEKRSESGALVGWQYDYFNRNGEVEWSDGSRYNPEDYVWRKYDGAGRPSEEIRWRSVAKADGSGVEAPMGDALYSTTLYTHDLFGNLTEIKDANRNSTVMTYDEIGRMKTRKSYQGYSSGTILAQESFTYEPGDEIATQTDALGGVTQILYTAQGQPKQQTNPDGTVLSWLYNLDGTPQKETLSNGSYWETTYAYSNRPLVTRTLKSSGGTTLATTTQKLDRRGNVLEDTDADGNKVIYAYDALDRVKLSNGPGSTGQPYKQVFTKSYDAAGKVTVSKNDRGEATTTTSDVLGRPVKVSITNPNGSLASETCYQYSADQNKVTVTKGTSAAAISSDIWTDTFGKTVIAKNGEGEKSVSAYDALGNLISSTDPLGQTTVNTYDGLSRLLTSTQPDGAITTFVYDAAGNMLERQMPGSLVEKNTYQTNTGKLLTTQLKNGGTTSRNFSYAYYGSLPNKGLLQTVTDPRGVVTTYAYDDFMRVDTATAVTGSSKPEENVTTDYDYNLRSLLTKVTETASGNTVETSRGYDGYSQLTSETVKLNSVTVSDLDQRWNQAGRRVELDVNGPLTDPLFTYQYQADGAMTQVKVNGTAFNFGYNTAGLLNSRANPFRTSVVQSRDNAGRILQLKTTAGTGTVLQEDLTWRDDSTLNSYVADRTGSGSWDETRSFGYNSRGRLASESYAPASGVSKTVNYEFDGNTTGGVGVRTKADVSGVWNVNATTVNSLKRVTDETAATNAKQVTAQGAALGAATVTTTLDSNPLGPVTFGGWMDSAGNWSLPLNLAPGSHTLVATATHPSGYQATATSTFTVNGLSGSITTAYDANGNVITRTLSGGRVQTLKWDGSGRLQSVTERDGSNNGFDWTAVYDGFDRRIQTTYQAIVANAASGSAKVVQSTYDPLVEFLEIGVKVDSAKSWKVYGPDASGDFGGLQGIGGLEAVVRETGSVMVGVAGDYFGNEVGTITQAGGSLAWKDALVTGYGNVPGSTVKTFKDSSNVEDVTGWRGRRVDETGFVNMGARHYEPNGGRFLSPDPAGHGSDMSLYAYANGDPVNQVDPDGRFGKPTGGGIHGNITYRDTHIQYAGEGWNSMSHDQQLSTVLNYIPVIGQLKSAGEAITGYDFVAKRYLSTSEQLMAAGSTVLGAIPGGGGVGSGAARAVIRTETRLAAGGVRNTIQNQVGKAVVENEPNIVYRALSAGDAEALAAGKGLTAKAPNGTWSAAQHVANKGPGVGGAAANSPWISTSKSLDVAKAYNAKGGHGIVAIDLNKVSSFQAEVWRSAPRVNGVAGLPYHRSFWAKEVTVFQEIPASAILGPVK